MRRLIAILTLLGARLAPCQQTGFPAVDSSEAARQAWARGAKAYAAKDFREAQREMTRAAVAWPTQPSYLWGRLLTSAKLHDTANVLAALRSYNAAGLGRPLAADSLFRDFRDIAEFRRLAAQAEANVAAWTTSHVVATAPDSTFWPEGVTYDVRTGNYYLASIRHRTIAELHADGTTRELWPRNRPDVGAVMGVRFDSARNVLWASMSGAPQMAGFAPGDTALAALFRIRVSDGVIERRWNIPPSARGHTLGDLALGPNGDVFMTDSNEPVLYRLRPGADTLEHMTHPLFRSLQGMAATTDGRTLYVADYSHGLLSVDLASGAVRRLGDAPGSSSIGCDGIVLDRTGAIIAVQNGVAPARVMRFVVDASRTSITSAQVLDRNSTVADEPTIGTIVKGEFVYVANSQWEKYDDNGRRKTSVPLTAPVLLGIPLP